jgi:hypothetical protein
MMLNLTEGTDCPVDEVGMIARRSSMLVTLRNQMVDQAITDGVDWLLWIDDDHSFPPDMARRLLAHDKPWIGINATTRNEPLRFTAWKKPGQMLVTDDTTHGIEKVWRMGMGISLISAEVFKAIDPPWFFTPYVETDEGRYFQGEDMYFCDKARAAGFDPFVDHDITKQTEHLTIVGRNHTSVDMAALSEEFKVKLG